MYCTTLRAFVKRWSLSMSFELSLVFWLEKIMWIMNIWSKEAKYILVEISFKKATGIDLELIYLSAHPEHLYKYFF